MKISVFSDVVCPWCYLGVTRLERAAAAYTLETGDPIEIALRAFQLDPRTPSDGTPLVEAIAEKFGGNDRAEQMFAQVSAAGRADGIDFDFSNAVQANTFAAHRLLTWAEGTVGLGAQRDLAHELWRAHFAEGADIADHDTLAARAAAAGLDAEAADAWLVSDGGAEDVRLQVETARSLGITAVPTAVLDGKYVASGAQPQQAYLRLLREVGDRQGAG